ACRGAGFPATKKALDTGRGPVIFRHPFTTADTIWTARPGVGGRPPNTEQGPGAKGPRLVGGRTYVREEMGLMRTRTLWRALLPVLAGLALVSAAHGQPGGLNYAPPDYQWPLPLYSDRPESGGLYTYGEFIALRTNNHLDHEPLAVQGFIDFD